MRVVLLLLLLALPALASPARDELQAWLRHPRQLPNFAGRVKALDDPDPAVRGRARDYLRELCLELIDLEEQGKSPVTPTPFFGGSPEVETRELRSRVLAEVGAHSHSVEALELARALLARDRLPDTAEYLAQLLLQTHSPESVALARELLAQPHPNAYLLKTAMKKVPPAEAAALGHHHRKAIRDLAGAAGPPHLTTALQSDLQQVASAVVAPIPAEARWVHVRAAKNVLPSALGVWSHEDLHEVSGWLLDESNGQLHLVDFYGTERRLPRASCKVQPRSWDEEVQALERARLTRGKQLTLDRFFEPEWLTLPELLVSAWCQRAGRVELTERLLIPRLEASRDDRELLGVGRFMLGHRYHQEMLDAFMRQDYAAASVFGHHLGGPAFEGFAYRARSEELARQLERRSEDFHTLVLPSWKEWQGLKTRLARPEKIRYLASRLRLLHCLQHGQPGGLDLGESQPGDHIHPFEELARLQLKPSDVRTLAPYLEDDSFVVGYSFHRDFHTSRHLCRVHELVADLIDGCVGHPVVDMAAVQGGDLLRRRLWLDSFVQSQAAR